MTTLLIARHGNTFEPDEPPRRVGARTDLPLVERGREQARALGRWMKQNGFYPESVYTSPLQRTIETARLALNAAGYIEPIYPLNIFTEIDYGPDEDKPEQDVVARVGAQAIKDWDEHATPPDGWIVDPKTIIQNWINFAAQQVKDDQNCVLVVTSNGIARFAPYITGDFKGYADKHAIKLSTGAVCVLNYANGQWTIKDWNLKPPC